jgi:S1-C subfamily serine protease
MRCRRPDLRAVAAVLVAVAIAPGCSGGDDQFLEQVETAAPPAQPGLPAADVADALVAVTVSVRAGTAVGVYSTGLYWRRRDTVVTVNASLARRADVVLASGRTTTGHVVGRDAATGIVVLHVTGPGPAPPAIARDAPRLGSQAVALSEGADSIARSTVASVSALDSRPVRGFAVTVVELDQAVDGAGAPVMNRRAEVIGVNVASASRRALVLPAATIDRIVSTLRAGRIPSHRTLGAHVVPLTRRVVSEFDLAVTRGVIVKAVDHGAPAERAGVRPGDIIVGIGGREIHDAADYLEADSPSAGTLEVVRGNRHLVLRTGRDPDVSER